LLDIYDTYMLLTLKLLIDLIFVRLYPISTKKSKKMKFFSNNPIVII